MDTKLTLKFNKSIIDKAKEYAKDRNISLSKMVENYFRALTNRQNKEVEITPLVESLMGVISLEETDYKIDYTNYLSEKYK